MILVVEPGPLASVQDPFGRPGWRRYGVPVGGAADGWSARLANRLAGNPDASAVIEVTLGGAELTLESASVIAVTGGLAATIRGRAATRAAGVRVAAGTTIRLEPSDGARGYLAVNGGVRVEPVMGSASTDLRTGFGGHEGRALRAGDRLALGPAAGSPGSWSGRRRDGPIRIVVGPHPEPPMAALAGAEWTVGVEADRAGVRLDGPRLDGSRSIASMGLPIGAIQVPPDGRPILMLVDRPVTGGYPVPACVIRADVGRVAQLLPGDPLRFEIVSPEEARDAWRAAERMLSSVEPIDADGELGWAGSHG
jgi:biotin-dependent carboxylase-like uncharacterized protein